MDVGNLTITVDTSGITDATEALDKLAQAVERVNAALAKLNGKDHGGITVEIVGSLVHAEVKAADRKTWLREQTRKHTNEVLAEMKARR